MAELTTDGRAAGPAPARETRRGGSVVPGPRRPADPVGMPRPARLRPWTVLVGLVAVGAAIVAGVALGPVRLPPGPVAVEVLNALPWVHLDSGLSAQQAAIVTELRLPRVVLALLVGAMLALAGGAYQGVFRNPLADPYLLGVAAGAGFAVTAVIAFRSSAGDATANLPVTVPIAAFAGAIGSVLLTYLLGASGGQGRRSPVTLILAGVAVSAFCAAGQTYLLQRNADTIREVYAWLTGRLATAGWHDVRVMLPYTVLTAIVVLLHRRELDVLSVGDEEAAGLGLHPQRSRYLLIAAASLGTAAAVSVSGLIGFVGIVVPHTVRLLFGSTYRVVLPLSMLFGAAFLALTDVAARTVAAPTEIPIGVVTALVGAPFFILVLRGSRGVTG